MLCFTIQENVLPDPCAISAIKLASGNADLNKIKSESLEHLLSTVILAIQLRDSQTEEETESRK